MLAAGHDLDDVLAKAAAIFFNQVFRDGYFHGDQHPGNMFVDCDGAHPAWSISASWGGSTARRASILADMLLGFLQRDYRARGRGAFRCRLSCRRRSRSTISPRPAARSASRSSAGRCTRSPSPACSASCSSIAESFEMEVQPQLLLLQKNMLMAEGVSRRLDPDAQHLDPGAAADRALDARESRARGARWQGRPGRCRAHHPPPAAVMADRCEHAGRPASAARRVRRRPRNALAIAAGPGGRRPRAPSGPLLDRAWRPWSRCSVLVTALTALQPRCHISPPGHCGTFTRCSTASASFSIIAGGIAAYKCLELIRRLRERGAGVRCILTAGRGAVRDAAVRRRAHRGEGLSATCSRSPTRARWAISACRARPTWWWSRRPPPTSSPRWRSGIADDLATTALLATDKPVLIAPAMNVRMWAPRGDPGQPGARWRRAACSRSAPASGDLACGEFGLGPHGRADGDPRGDRGACSRPMRALAGRRALVTSGPTHEPIDPVRYHRQPLLRQAGPCHRRRAGAAAAPRPCWSPARPREPDPRRRRTCAMSRRRREMLAACREPRCRPISPSAPPRSPTGVAAQAAQKIKKTAARRRRSSWPRIPTSSRRCRKRGNARPRLVVGFAAETENVRRATRRTSCKRKGCDWIVANDVSPAHRHLRRRRQHRCI